MKGMAAQTVLLVLVAAWMAAGSAPDWPQWGGQGSRNMVSPERRLPDDFDAGAGLLSGRVGRAGRNVRWVARIGASAWGSPVAAGGKVYVGCSSTTPYDARRSIRGGGALLCFEERTGRFLWQLLIPRFRTADPMFNFDHLNYGVCSTPAVEGNRLYFVSNRDELLCVDVAGQANGNDGPFTDESRFMSDDDNPPAPLTRTDGDIVWRVDMIGDRDVDAWPQDAADCSPLVLGDYVYASPSNGVDRSHKHIPRPKAPSVIAVDKRSGRVVARDDAGIGPRIFHGEWSSPSAGRVNGRELVFWGGGDGVCYAFDARPARPAPGERLGSLQTVWRFDVDAAAGRVGRYRTVTGPSEVIGTPVYYRNRVYVAIGQDPTHGRGRGALACIDATLTGDITQRGKVWLFDGIDRSISTVAIAAGLLYAADNSGRVFCLDADNGRQYWMFDTKQPICSSPLAADGKVYVGTDRGDLWVFAAGKECRVLNTVHVGSAVGATPAVASGTLYVVCQGWLYAAALGTKE